MRGSTKSIDAKPLRLPRHTGLRPTQHKIALPLIACPRSEATAGLTCHGRRWGMTSGIGVVNIELARAASRVRPLAFGVSFADQRGGGSFRQAEKAMVP